MSSKMVPYYRVSTMKQGQSGLGLEAQQSAVETYARSVGAQVLSPAFVEVESGKRKDRPELLKAIMRAKALRATLVIAKLDRLARNVAFVSALMETGIDFMCCDNPHANRLTIHILAAVAEDEAKRISERTKAALAAYKARGGKLGGQRDECRHNLGPAAIERGRSISAEVRKKAAEEHLAAVLPTILELRQQGLTQQRIADHLNEQGFTTRRGNRWGQVQVKLALDRVPAAN